jgi:hypothetical protein
MVGSELVMGLSAFKTMFDMAKALKDMDDATRRNGAVIDLQGQILAAQMQQAALIEQVGQLETKVRGFEKWEAEKDRYKLEKLPPGVLVRTLKEEAANGEPIHHICESCYQNGRKSPLHQDEHSNGIHHLMCNACQTQLRVGHFRMPPMQQVDYDPF